MPSKQDCVPSVHTLSHAPSLHSALPGQACSLSSPLMQVTINPIVSCMMHWTSAVLIHVPHVVPSALHEALLQVVCICQFPFWQISVCPMPVVSSLTHRVVPLKHLPQALSEQENSQVSD